MKLWQRFLDSFNVLLILLNATLQMFDKGSRLFTTVVLGIALIELSHNSPLTKLVEKITNSATRNASLTSYLRCWLLSDLQ